MRQKNRWGGAFTAFLLSSQCATALAASVSEVEPNHPIGSAQHLGSSGTEIEVNGALSSAVSGGDVDFYLFHAKAGDVITLDIDNGFTGIGDPNSVNTVLAVFGPGPGYELLRQNDNTTSLDEGSVSFYDARIDDFVAPYTGSYVVGVSSYPRLFENGGATRPHFLVDSGTYTLRITGISPAVRQVPIEVKPGDDKVAPLNPRSKGKIPVAILGTPDFHALNVDKTSLTFGSTGDEPSLYKCDWHGRDVNGDGKVDLVCHFDTERAEFQWTDLEGVLKGKTNAGEAFVGRAWLKMLPATTSSSSAGRAGR